MKKRVSLAVTALLALGAMLIAAGCANNSEPQTTPAPSPAAMASPSPQSEGPMTEASPDVQQSPMTGGAIENFVEGAVVELAQLPAEITEAIRKEYADATVKSASYATYENQQMYRVSIERAEDEAAEDVYVTADGQIIPAKATAASPSPEGGSGSGGTDAAAGGVESGK
ncbi:MAG: hypothetical protein IJB30_08265 [Clostridia bacterium]|nr:hypothetical protein [Clostridia bacterium]